MPGHHFPDMFYKTELLSKESVVLSSAYRDVGLISMVSEQIGALNRLRYLLCSNPCS